MSKRPLLPFGGCEVFVALVEAGTENPLGPSGLVPGPGRGSRLGSIFWYWDGR